MAVSRITAGDMGHCFCWPAGSRGNTFHWKLCGRLGGQSAVHVMAMWMSLVMPTAPSICHRVAVEGGQTNFFRPCVSSAAWVGLVSLLTQPYQSTNLACRRPHGSLESHVVADASMRAVDHTNAIETDMKRHWIQLRACSKRSLT